MRAIMIQLERELKRFEVTKGSIETLFIGGGTPSCVKAEEFQPFFDLIKPFLQKNAEITTEANPNSATYEWLEGMYHLGVNRVSFGVQSFNQEKLKRLNRNHAPDDALNAIQNAHKIGFKNLSLDLIYGNEGDSNTLLSYDLDTAFSLPINHISAYSLTIEEGTQFFNTPEVAKDDEEKAFWFVKEIQKRGLAQYEISNFGTYQSQHNKGYWQYKDYMGIGSGAVGFLKDTRFYTQNDVHAYIENPNTITEEALTGEDIKNEKVLLGLRSNIGFSEQILTNDERIRAHHLVEAEKMSYHDRTFFNTNFFLADELALYITTN